MEDPWGHNAWATTGAGGSSSDVFTSSNPSTTGEEHDLAASLNPSLPSWGSGIRWNDDPSADSSHPATPWGTSTFSNIGAALSGGSSGEGDTDTVTPVHSTRLVEDPWGTNQTPLESSTSSATPPYQEEPSTSPRLPEVAWTPPSEGVVNSSETSEPKLHEPNHVGRPPDISETDSGGHNDGDPIPDESDPWGTGLSTEAPFPNTGSSPFGISAIKLDDAFPLASEPTFPEEDSTSLEPPPPLPKSLDEMPSISVSQPQSLPEPETDEWGQEENAWGPSVSSSAAPQDDHKDDEDEWTRASKAREKQDELIPPERLQALINDTQVLFGPPMSPPLDEGQTDDNWREAPQTLIHLLTPALEVIASSPNAPSSQPASSLELDPWASQSQQSSSPHPESLLPTPHLVLPTLTPFGQTNTFKSFTNAIKLTRNTPIATRSVLTHFIHAPTSSNFEKWEAAMKLRKDLTTDEQHAGDVPKGWRLSLEEKTVAPTATKQPSRPGLFSFFSSSSTKPMTGFGSTNTPQPHSAGSNSPSRSSTPKLVATVKSTASTPRTSMSVERQPSAPPSAPATASIQANPPLPEAPASLFGDDAAAQSPSSVEPPTTPSGAVSRFFSRFTSGKRASLPPQKKSVELSDGDFAFLADVKAGDNAAENPIADRSTFALSGALEGSSILPARLDPPPAPKIQPQPSPIPGTRAVQQVSSLLSGSVDMNSKPSTHSSPPQSNAKEDDFGAFEDVPGPSLVSLAPVSAPPSKPVASEAGSGRNAMDQFDLIFGSASTAPPALPQIPVHHQSVPPPTPSSTPRYTPPQYSGSPRPSASAQRTQPQPKRRQTPVAIMSTSRSGPDRASSFSIPKLDAPGLPFALSPPPAAGGTKPDIDQAHEDNPKRGGLLGTLEENAFEVVSKGMSLSNGLATGSTAGASTGSAMANVLNSIDLSLGSDGNGKPTMNFSGSIGSGTGTTGPNVLDSFDLSLGLGPGSVSATSNEGKAKVAISIPPTVTSLVPKSNVLDAFDLSLGAIRATPLGSTSPGVGSNIKSAADTFTSLAGFAPPSTSPPVASEKPSSSLGGFDDFEDFVSGSDPFPGSSMENQSQPMQAAHSPPQVPNKSSDGHRQPQPQQRQPKIPLHMGPFAIPSVPTQRVATSLSTIRKGSLPLPPPPPSDDEEWGDFGFVEANPPVGDSGNGALPKVPLPSHPPPAGLGGAGDLKKGFGWTPPRPNQAPLPSKATEPKQQAPSILSHSQSEPTAQRSNLSASSNNKPSSPSKVSHQKTLSLVGMAAQSKGIQWPAPPSPIPPPLNPPLPPPPLFPPPPGNGVKTTGGGAWEILDSPSPPPSSAATTMQDSTKFKLPPSGAGMMGPPPADGTGALLAPAPLNSSSSFKNPVVATNGNVSGGGAGGGGLSAQDLSFFEGL